MCMDHDRDSREIEGHGRMSTLGLGLGRQFEKRSVGPLSSNEDSFSVDTGSPHNKRLRIVLYVMN